MSSDTKQPDKTIALVGLMGCGKSAIGHRLAARLDLPFLDLDKEIEKMEGLTIPEIFEKHGEQYFRAREKDIAGRILDGYKCVLATGGGAFINDEIRAMIKEKAISIWLKASFEVLLERVSRKNNRPLLEKGDKAAILKDLMEKRYPIYEHADIVVDTTEGMHDIVVNNIVEKL